MKKLLILTIILLSGCTAPKNYQRQIEVSSEMGATLCRGDRVKSFIETSYYHAITCEGGQYFFLKRKDTN